MTRLDRFGGRGPYAIQTARGLFQGILLGRSSGRWWRLCGFPFGFKPAARCGAYERQA